MTRLVARGLVWISLVTTAVSFLPNRAVHRGTPRAIGVANLSRGDAEASTSWLPPPMLASLLLLASLPAGAVETSVLTNDYSDPLHPLCRRHIEVSADGKSFTYSGTAVGGENDPAARGLGCSPKEIQLHGIRRGGFSGVIVRSEGNQIGLNSGDGLHEGIWEPAGSAQDRDGIRWQDGNKWIVQKKSKITQAGEFLTFAYIGFSLLAGVKGVYNMYQQKMRQ